ncbi:MAG: hypothetical protein GX811_02430 [Lentisphaerae bacterium]|nr:hypothetical protein [Lentisphaerota bacterium]
MTMKKQIFLLFVLIFTVICLSQAYSASLDNISTLEKAIKSGMLGDDFAIRARKTGNIYAQEIKNPGIPYKVFTFSDYQAGYTVLVEKNNLILLCAGFGGGTARDFVIRKENGREVLYYHFDVGSGVRHQLSGRYVLGSNRATWDNWDLEKLQQ